MTEVLHIYTRVSTAVQADEGMSLDFQRDLGIQRANQLGFDYKVWNEGGKSSNHEELDKRPVLSQVLSEIKKGNIKHLFVFDQSRLSRNDYVSSIFRYECNKQGVVLYNKDGKYDLSNPQDQLTKQLMDAIAQFDNATRAERTRLGKLARVKQGFWHGGPPIYGYKIENRKLVIDEDEAQWVRRIFEEYVKGTTLFDIKVLLESNNIKTRRGNSNWTIGSLQSILTNTHYIGYYKFKDARSNDEVQVSCPNILSAIHWTKVKEKQERNAKRRNVENPTRHFYMLRGLLKCSHCGTLLSGSYTGSTNRRYVYSCPKKLRVWGQKRAEKTAKKWQRGRVCSMTRSLDMQKTDELVWNSVIEVISNSTTIKNKVKWEALGENYEKTKQVEQDIDALKRKIREQQKLEKKYYAALARLEADRIMEQVSPNEYPLIRHNIQEQLTATQANIEQLQEEVQTQKKHEKWIDWVLRFRKQIDEFKKFTPKQKQEFLQGVLESVDVELSNQQTHRIVLNFQMPIVGDAYQRTMDSKEYIILAGQKVKVVESPIRAYSKKNLDTQIDA